MAAAFSLPEVNAPGFPETFRQYRTNRQESLARDFSSEKGVKPQEYFVYFKVLQTHFWWKRSWGPRQSPASAGLVG